MFTYFKIGVTNGNNRRFKILGVLDAGAICGINQGGYPRQVAVILNNCK